MTNGKRTNFKDAEELQGLLEAAWNRLEERSHGGMEQGKTIRMRKCVFSVKSVSEEASCARSLVGYGNCPYPTVRKWLTDKIEAQAARGPSLLVSLSEEVARLNRKMKARYLAYDALCKKLGIRWARSSEFYEDAQQVGEGSVKTQIAELRARVAELERRVALYDTQYANVILRQRLANLGLRSDMRPIKPASKAKRRASISIVGKSVTAQLPD